MEISSFQAATHYFFKNWKSSSQSSQQNVGSFWRRQPKGKAQLDRFAKPLPGDMSFYFAEDPYWQLTKQMRKRLGVCILVLLRNKSDSFLKRLFKHGEQQILSNSKKTFAQYPDKDEHLKFKSKPDIPRRVYAHYSVICYRNNPMQFPESWCIDYYGVTPRSRRKYH